MDFYTGRVLRLDMTALTATVEPLDEEWARLYVGGKGLLLRYLFAELAPGTDALAPENPLILASGPFAGTAAATCSRLAVGCKSPATGTLLDSYVGGSFAPELKFAGYDVVVVTGRAPHPVLVLVEDDRVDFLPAEGRFWGLETAALEQKVREEMGPWHKVLSTGPAGEQLVPFACLSTDQYHKAGRGGAGAVMGSKNLKAVVVRGTGAVTVGDATAFAARPARAAERPHPHRRTTPGPTRRARRTSSTSSTPPARCRRATGARASSRARTASTPRSSSRCAPRSAPARSARSPAARSTGSATTSAKGPEFETLGLCGANCGIGDLATIAAFNGACDELGLDTMSTGAVVALAMDLCERGAADYGLAFGDADGYLAAPGLIARREGWGAELALGARDLAALKGRPELAPHIKGLELPSYDPRGTFGMGLGYATSDRGACHMRAFTAGDDILGGSAPADSLEGKPALVAEQQDFSALAWTGVWCANMYMDTDFLAVHFRHLWGRETSHEELMTTGARIWNLGRLLNLREGFGREHDRLPAILDVPHPDGAAAGKTVGADEFRAALDEYYRVRGWDADGVPTEETLARLSLDVRL